MSKQQGSGSGLITGAVVGGIVGAAAALLLAPKSGEQLRSELGRTLQVLGQRTREVAESVCANTKEAAQGAVEGVKEAAVGAAEGVKGATQSVKGAALGIKSDVNSMAPLQDDIQKLGKEMDAMPTGSELKSKGLQSDPAQ